MSEREVHYLEIVRKIDLFRHLEESQMRQVCIPTG
jgi:hypothetical protein